MLQRETIREGFRSFDANVPERAFVVEGLDLADWALSLLVVVGAVGVASVAVVAACIVLLAAVVASACAAAAVGDAALEVLAAAVGDAASEVLAAVVAAAWVVPSVPV